MRINLNEIPADGRVYEYSRSTGELNTALEDLLEKNPYDVELFIKPMGNAFEMKGKLTSRKTALCSKCGFDIVLPLSQTVKEILIEEPKEEYRKDQAVHGNGAIDFLADAPGVTHYQSPFFNIGDYVHEAFALAEPFYPECGVNDCKNLKEVEAKLRELEVSFEEGQKLGHPAFSILQKLKKN